MSRYATLALLAALTGSAGAALAQQDAQSQFMEGERYRVGMGIPSDQVKAREWYLKAAAQGHARAQYQLGMIYNYGRGVPKDAPQAIAWVQEGGGPGLCGRTARAGRDLPVRPRGAEGLDRGVPLVPAIR
jgi:TPR repeat protein